MENMVKEQEKKPISRSLVIINVLLACAVIAVVLFIWRPWQVEEIDTSSGQWVHDIVGEYIELPHVDFYDNCYVRHSGDNMEVTLSYASQEDSEVMLGEYLAIIEDPTENPPPHEGALSVDGFIGGIPVTVTSRFEEICYIYTITMDFSGQTSAEEYKQVVAQDYPTHVVEACPELSQLVSAEQGGYVFYEYDMFDKVRFADVPQYSKAYTFEGGAQEFEVLAEQIVDTHGEDAQYVAENAQVIFVCAGQRVIISFIGTGAQGGDMVSVSMQEIPQGNLDVQ